MWWHFYNLSLIPLYKWMKTWRFVETEQQFTCAKTLQKLLHINSLRVSYKLSYLRHSRVLRRISFILWTPLIAYQVFKPNTFCIILLFRSLLLLCLSIGNILLVCLSIWRLLLVCLNICNQILILVNSFWKCKGDKNTSGLWKKLV